MTTMQRPPGLPAPSYLGRPEFRGTGPALPGIHAMQSQQYGAQTLPRIELPPLQLGRSDEPHAVEHARSQPVPICALLSHEMPFANPRGAAPQHLPPDNFAWGQPARLSTVQPSYTPSPMLDTRHDMKVDIPPRRPDAQYSHGHRAQDRHDYTSSQMSQSSSPSTYSRTEDTSPRSSMAPPNSARLGSRGSNLHFTLLIRQQPAAARACGFGERDRRVIDPPPILELRTTDAETGAPRDDHQAMLALHCTLMTPDGRHDDTEVPGSEPNTQATRRLMGTLVSSPYPAKDEHDVAGLFFVFPDLSCRSPGRYRLRFKLIRIDPANMRPGQSSPVVANIMSDIFAVFTAKDFPGMRASSALLKALRRQGLNVGVKKGSEARKGKGKTKKEESDSDDEDDSERSEDERRASTASRSTGGVSPRSKPARKMAALKRKRRES
ncbi:hypothetical protein LTR62_002929 [Meristemomyces frigidus]|uniref:Velvet domain-containing protein n=1 Tax=Meristemomyces frigidus TaxID=1508187 RepID=A0AAN7YUF6_9PEZI|nr:hypothetical protein LTR62_002929 [Meristemomyces frigidus]